ncbi:membrane protein EE22 [Proboscivirus elephantidbeta5]|uniref:Membrane protein EE22 n=1 Tax=Elephant endotheliotropic herpesvirus 5 TaxID=768738 RepID=A0A075CYS3_9BETA|nr:membrane protein EE22 [Elephant endotheliotropic herpesvirus 5]AHC02872.1 membrane protein EE22 [Elephant endotheliotropic herpesvirus 5]
MYSLTCVFVLIYIIQKTEGFVETFNISSLPHKNVTLKCTFNDTTKNIFAIQWQADNGNHSSYIATIKEINEDKEKKIQNITYFNYSGISVACEQNMKATTLTIINVTKQNAACFNCKFKVTAEPGNDGYMNRTCINLYDNPTLSLMSTLSTSKTSITCLSTGYLQPSVKWINVSGMNNLTENITNHNGTISVKNTLYVNSLKDGICCENSVGNVTCIKPYETHEKLNQLITSICIVLFIVMMAIGITSYLYYVKRRNKRTKNTGKLKFY